MAPADAPAILNNQPGPAAVPPAAPAPALAGPAAPSPSTVVPNNQVSGVPYSELVKRTGDGRIDITHDAHEDVMVENAFRLTRDDGTQQMFVKGWNRNVSRYDREHPYAKLYIRQPDAPEVAPAALGRADPVTAAELQRLNTAVVQHLGEIDRLRSELSVANSRVQVAEQTAKAAEDRARIAVKGRDDEKARYHNIIEGLNGDIERLTRPPPAPPAPPATEPVVDTTKADASEKDDEDGDDEPGEGDDAGDKGGTEGKPGGKGKLKQFRKA